MCSICAIDRRRNLNCCSRIMKVEIGKSVTSCGDSASAGISIGGGMSTNSAKSGGTSKVEGSHLS